MLLVEFTCEGIYNDKEFIGRRIINLEHMLSVHPCPRDPGHKSRIWMTVTTTANTPGGNERRYYTVHARYEDIVAAMKPPAVKSSELPPKGGVAGNLMRF